MENGMGGSSYCQTIIYLLESFLKSIFETLNYYFTSKLQNWISLRWKESIFLYFFKSSWKPMALEHWNTINKFLYHFTILKCIYPGGIERYDEFSRFERVHHVSDEILVVVTCNIGLVTDIAELWLGCYVNRRIISCASNASISWFLKERMMRCKIYIIINIKDL